MHLVSSRSQQPVNSTFSYNLPTATRTRNRGDIRMGISPTSEDQGRAHHLRGAISEAYPDETQLSHTGDPNDVGRVDLVIEVAGAARG
uniref:Uncharacterized protein n=1 Tax=Trichogramma kaykai TaxID=54128 RepID=A0ABD2WII2_9HYME